MSSGRSVVVTGTGALCAGGRNIAELWQSALAGRVNATWSGDGPSRVAVYRAPEFSTPDTPSLNPRRADRTVLLALAAAHEAAHAAALPHRPVRPERLGVFIGSSRGPLDAWSRILAADDPARHPTLLANSTIGSLSGALSIAFTARGPNLTVSTTCASAAHAIALAAEHVASGAIDAAIAGGSDSPLHPALLEQFRAAGLLGTHDDPRCACRPFDLTRDGTALGEGAGMLFLESADSARRRGVSPLATLAGWAMTSDAEHRVNVSEVGLRRAIVAAVERAAIDPAAIGYTNAHGTGTQQNDLCESRVLAALLGVNALCSSTKPITGHCAGATPALEAILSIQTLLTGLAPPTATCTTPDPDCPIDPIPSAPRPLRPSAVLSTSLGIWGNNAALIFAKPSH